MTAPTLDSTRLVTEGCFPREIPPCFATSALAQVLKCWQPEKKAPATHWCRHDFARAGGLRRPLHLPHPEAYARLARALEQHWNEIDQHLGGATFSISRPRLTSPGFEPRPISPWWHLGSRTRLRALRRRGARYLVRADVERFYPTLYTHTVPWALHSRSMAKGARGEGQLAGNAIDKALSRLADDQTHGIPIGPDASLVVAEIVLSAVDKGLASRLGALPSGFRYIDDYEMAFNSADAAERGLAALEASLADFELALNPSKTGITELPTALEEDWARTLRHALIRDASSPNAQRNDIISLFSRAFELAREHPKQPVIKYALARLRNTRIDPRTWRTVQNCALTAAAAEPSAIPAALGLLAVMGKRLELSVAKAGLEEVLTMSIARDAARAHAGEVAWGLWAALAWEVKLPDDVGERVSALDDDLVAVLALEAQSRQLLNVDPKRWQDAVSGGDCYAEHWLLRYECARNGWLGVSPPDRGLLGEAFAGGASFFLREFNTPHLPTAALALLGRGLPDHYG